MQVVKAFSAPIALFCLAQVPGGPLDFEGAWGLVLGALGPGCLREGEHGQVQGETWCDPERWVRLCGQRDACMPRCCAGGKGLQ